MNNKKTYAFIFARGGSKGLPNKNILKVGGVPMIVRAINISKSINEIAETFVSTDCKEIASMARQHGAVTIMRPQSLSTDDAPEWQAWQHAIEHVKKERGGFDIFISLPATAPLREAKDVQRCIRALKNEIDIVVTMTISKRSPEFNMVEKKDTGNIKLLNSGNVSRRQDAGRCYDMATVAYVTTPSFVLSQQRIWDGNVYGIEIDEQHSIDIDTYYDYRIADLLATYGAQNNQ